jgi:fatty-acid desaturase
MSYMNANNSALKSGFVFLGFVFILMMIAYNIWLFRMIYIRKISHRQKDHNAFLRRKELEYVLDISVSWRKQSYFLFASYKGTKLRMYNIEY